MALDERYFTPIALEVNFIDNDTGLPLSGGYAEFYKDNSRASPKPVYQLTGSPPNYTYTALSNPLYMNAVGKFIPAVGSTTPIAVYAYPYDEDGNIENYYVVIKSSDGTVQEVREAWPNISTGTNPSGAGGTSFSNQISNSQFVEVFFEQGTGATISITGSVSNASYSIAPDWDLLISTTGNATVTLNRTAIAGSLNLPTNPPYTLDVLTSGANISRLRLRQRLSHNPDIWANGYVSGHFVISSQDGQNHTVEMLYSPSIAPSPTTILTGTTGTSGYQEYNATVAIDAGTNTSTSLTGYVDILIDLPTVGHYDITSVQLVGLDSQEENVPYNEDTVNRQEDYLFHYYNPLLQYRATESYLTGWFFPYNPAQLGETISMGAIGANKSVYLWDQTIGFQSTDDSWGASRSVLGQFKITTTDTTQPAVIQYLDQQQIRDLLSRPASVYSKMMKGSSTTSPTCTISLWYTKDASLPDVSDGTNNSLVLTLDSNGKPATFNGSWTEIPRTGIGTPQFTVSATSGLAQDEEYLTHFYLDDETEASSATFGAIVVGFSSMVAASELYLTDISIVPGNTASPTPPQDTDEVYQDCAYFYETSYEIGVAPGTITTDNQKLFLISFDAIAGGGTSRYVRSFEFSHYLKRAVPDVTLYSPVTGASGEVSASSEEPNEVVVNGPTDKSVATYWNSHPGTKVARFEPATASVFITTSAGTNLQTLFKYHYVVDARLGIV